MTAETIRLGDLKNREVPLDVEFEGDTFKIKYRPHVLKPVFMANVAAKISDATTNGEVYAALREILPDVVVSTNAVDDADQPATITVLLGELAEPAAWTFWQAIQGHLRPNPASAGS